MVRLNMGEGVELIIRYVATTGEAKAAPIIDISVNQLTWLLVSLLGTVLFLFYVFLYAPAPQEPPVDETIPPRKAQFIYKRPMEEIKPVEVAPIPKTAQETIKDKEVAPARGEEGAAQEAKPNKSQSKKQILTADKAGKDKGIQKAQNSQNPNKDTGAKSKSKDVTKSGVLGAFAFTLSVPLILLGNGIGAVVVRQITVSNVDRIKKYVYLKNGAMYSILALGTIMVLDGFGYHIPHWLSPTVTFGTIGYFFFKSKQAIKVAEAMGIDISTGKKVSSKKK
jgi:hypothetical protein